MWVHGNVDRGQARGIYALASVRSIMSEQSSVGKADMQYDRRKQLPRDGR